MSLQALPPALQRLVDKDEIHELKHSFAWAIETNDAEILAGLFTEDAVVNANPKHPLRGRDEIRARYRDVFAAWDGPFSSFHVVTNARIRVDDDEASGTWYLMNSFTHNGGAPLQVIGVYDERYRRDRDGRWRISNLKLTYIWTETAGRIDPEHPVIGIRPVAGGSP